MVKYYLQWETADGNKGQGPAIFTKEEAGDEALRLMAKYQHLVVKVKKQRKKRAGYR